MLIDHIQRIEQKLFPEICWSKCTKCLVRARWIAFIAKLHAMNKIKTKWSSTLTVPLCLWAWLCESRLSVSIQYSCKIVRRVRMCVLCWFGWLCTIYASVWKRMRCDSERVLNETKSPSCMWMWIWQIESKSADVPLMCMYWLVCVEQKLGARARNRIIFLSHQHSSHRWFFFLIDSSDWTPHIR